MKLRRMICTLVGCRVDMDHNAHDRTATRELIAESRKVNQVARDVAKRADPTGNVVADLVTGRYRARGGRHVD